MSNDNKPYKVCPECGVRILVWELKRNPYCDSQCKINALQSELDAARAANKSKDLRFNNMRALAEARNTMLTKADAEIVELKARRVPRCNCSKCTKLPDLYDMHPKGYKADDSTGNARFDQSRTTSKENPNE